MPYSLVIFDLDGTLVDSFPWFLRTINDVADYFGFRRVGLLPGVAYRYGRWADSIMVQRSLAAGSTEPPLISSFGR